MIHLEKVTKYFEVKKERKYILKDVTMTIPSGTNLGILGLNGAGKSTLLRMLGGIDFPNSGRIESDVDFSWPLGLSGGTQGSLTGRENAQFICRVYSLSEQEIEQTLNFILEFTELGSYFDMPVKTYSSGMNARLRFATSLAFDFDYYLIDETLSVGDPKFKRKAKAALDDLLRKRNFLMVSHSLPVLKQMCDSGIVLSNGRLSYFDDIRQAIDAYQSL
jgi:capsular polysaccharide transport system ATP-binding protein